MAIRADRLTTITKSFESNFQILNTEAPDADLLCTLLGNKGGESKQAE
jgi:hypothetical protein